MKQPEELLMTNIVDHHELPTTTLGDLPMARDRGGRMVRVA